MTNKSLITYSILTTSFIFGISYLIILSNLIVTEVPIQSDIIIVLEGGTINRAEAASSLLHQNYSKVGQVIVSPLNQENSHFYQNMGISNEQILPELEATSTYENAKYTLEMMHDKGFDSAIVLSSDYHMLRTQLTFERVNKKYNYDLTYVAAFHQVENELKPWFNAGPEIKKAARKEVWKYLGYLLGLYHFINL